MFADNVANSLSQSQMYTALRMVLLNIVNIPVIQSQQNRNAAPTGNFITMTALGLDARSTNRITYDNQSSVPGEENHHRTLVWRVQIDCYGDEAATMANTIATLFRSEWACEAFGATGYAVVPLFAGEPHQTSFINSESAYEGRWTLDLHMQADVAVTAPRYFFDNATITPVSVDTLD